MCACFVCFVVVVVPKGSDLTLIEKYHAAFAEKNINKYYERVRLCSVLYLPSLRMLCCARIVYVYT